MQAQCSFKLDLTKAVPVIADVATKMGPFPLRSQGRYLTPAARSLLLYKFSSSLWLSHKDATF